MHDEHILLIFTDQKGRQCFQSRLSGSRLTGGSPTRRWVCLGEGGGWRCFCIEGCLPPGGGSASKREGFCLKGGLPPGVGSASGGEGEWVPLGIDI